MFGFGRSKTFLPARGQGPQALEAALNAWQSGHATGTVPGTTNPVVQFVDSHHTPGRRLKSFAVLGLAPGEGPRVFTVKLTLDGPSAEVKTRYVVFGLDPHVGNPARGLRHAHPLGPPDEEW